MGSPENTVKISSVSFELAHIAAGGMLWTFELFDAAADRPEGPGDRRQSGAHCAGLCGGRAARKTGPDRREHKRAWPQGDTASAASDGIIEPGARTADCSGAVGGAAVSGTGRRSADDIALIVRQHRLYGRERFPPPLRRQSVRRTL
jgi:hypothetical protein